MGWFCFLNHNTHLHSAQTRKLPFLKADGIDINVMLDVDVQAQFKLNAMTLMANLSKSEGEQSSVGGLTFQDLTRFEVDEINEIQVIYWSSQRDDMSEAYNSFTWRFKNLACKRCDMMKQQWQLLCPLTQTKHKYAPSASQNLPNKHCFKPWLAEVRKLTEIDTCLLKLNLLLVRRIVWTSIYTSNTQLWVCVGGFIVYFWIEHIACGALKTCVGVNHRNL